MEMLIAARDADREYQSRMGLPDYVGVGEYDHYIAMLAAVSQAPIARSDRVQPAPSPADERAAFDPKAVADSLASMLVVWVDDCMRMNLDWRDMSGVIEKRVRRLMARSASANETGAEGATVDPAARMDWAQGILRKLPSLDPTYSIIAILDDSDPEDRDELLHSIRAFADMRATQALSTLYAAAADPRIAQADVPASKHAPHDDPFKRSIQGISALLEDMRDDCVARLNVGDADAMVAAAFIMLVRKLVDRAFTESAAQASYDGNHVENHCPECSQYESECECAQADARVGLTAAVRATIMDACQSISRSADALKDCHTVDGDWGDDLDAKAFYDAELRLLGRLTALLDHPGQPKPLDMLLFCPKCGVQHVDGVEDHEVDHGSHVEVMADWMNPPHRSHLCHACGTIWRPADVPTNGVAAIATRGKADTWDGKPEPRAEVTEAARDVLTERRRQVTVEGWTPEHDAAHDCGELARAAACYALHAGSRYAWSHEAYQASTPHEGNPQTENSLWPWDQNWWKPKNPRRDLVRAAALIIAEIERIDHAAARTGASS